LHADKGAAKMKSSNEDLLKLLGDLSSSEPLVKSAAEKRLTDIDFVKSVLIELMELRELRNRGLKP
jgi:hypothetical protein